MNTTLLESSIDKHTHIEKFMKKHGYLAEQAYHKALKEDYIDQLNVVTGNIKDGSYLTPKEK